MIRTVYTMIHMVKDQRRQKKYWKTESQKALLEEKKWSRHWRIEFLQVFSHKLPHSWRVVKHFVWYIWFCQEEYFPGLSCSVSHFCFLSAVLLSWECCSHVHFTLSTTPSLQLLSMDYVFSFLFASSSATSKLEFPKVPPFWLLFFLFLF